MPYDDFTDISFYYVLFRWYIVALRLMDEQASQSFYCIRIFSDVFLLYFEGSTAQTRKTTCMNAKTYAWF
jgi:hypothetical protein